ncbi:MAG: hypothetical protein ABIT20_16615 [Gemmatimonadaceae bacterium]
MRKSLNVLLFTALVVGTGCSMLGRKSGPEMNADYSVVRTRWNATLATPSQLAGAMQIHGTSSWSNDGTSTSRADILLTNATPGGVHPWHVHYGRCGGNGGVVGDPAAYELLKVDGDGKSAAKAMLSIPLPRSGDYYVNVHAAQSNMGTIIACGNLASPTQ